MSLLAVRRAIKKTLLADMGELLEVQEHGGRFGVDELARFSLKAPCAIVCSLGIDSISTEGDLPVAHSSWGVFFVTKDTPKLKRDESALVLVGKAFKTINQLQRWGFDDGVHMMDSIKGINLYAGKGTDEKGVSLWAIQWTQGVDIQLLDIDTLDDFITYDAVGSIPGASTDTPKIETEVTLPAYGS